MKSQHPFQEHSFRIWKENGVLRWKTLDGWGKKKAYQIKKIHVCLQNALQNKIIHNVLNRSSNSPQKIIHETKATSDSFSRMIFSAFGVGTEAKQGEDDEAMSIRLSTDLLNPH